MTTLKNSIRRLRQFLRPQSQPTLAVSRTCSNLPPPRFIDCFELEDRALPSATPLGVETPVNTTAAGSQQTFAETPQAVASDASGNYVTAWSSLNQDGSGWGVYAQRFNSAGVAQGGEILVNTATANDQQYAAVAMDADGDFVVVWSTDAAGDAGIRAQRFNASGVAQGGEIAVNAFTTDDQTFASVAMDDNGNFVITWSSINQDGGGWGIYAERYNASGAGQGDFLVNTTTAGDQIYSQVAMDANGDFVITWETDLQLGSGYGIFGQRYNSSGVAQGGEFLINTTTAGDQRRSAIDMDAAGNFVVTWTSAGQDGSGGGIYAQRFNSVGTAVGGEFLVNATTAGDQDYSRVSMNAGGEFMVTWSSFNQDAVGTWGVYAQKYTAAGAVEEAEFRVNTTTAGNQRFSGVAMTPNNSAVFIWSGIGTGDADGVFMQRYSFNDAPIVTTSGSALAYVENSGAIAVDGGLTVTDADNATLTGATITISGNYINGQDTLSFTDQNGITGNWNAGSGTLTLSGASSVANYQAALRSITYTNNSDDPSAATRTVSFNVSDGLATSSVATRDITLAAVNDAPVLANIEAAALAYTENGSSLVTSSITIADVDSAVLTSAAVQITGNYVLGQDQLTFTNTATITGAWDAATGTLTLSGADSVANYQAALRSVGYTNTSDNPNTLVRTATFRVNDGAANSNTQTRDITIAAVNDAPVNTIPGPQVTGEDTPLVFSGANGNQISMSDVDAGASPVQVSLSAANGTMTLAQTAGLTFITGDGLADANLSFTGTIAAINSALDGLTFTPTIDYVGPASIQFLTDDQGNSGSGLALADSDTININVGTANDAPVNSVPGPQATNEDTPLVFASGNGNQLSIGDNDAGASPVRVSLSATSGTMTLGQTAGLSFVSGDGAADATMSFTGTVAAINAALNGLIFAPAANFAGAASLQVVTDDLGGTGVGGALSDTDSFNVTVAAVNDSPAITVPGPQSTGGAVVFSSAQGNPIVLADVDAGASTLELVLDGSNGTFSLASSAGITLLEGTGINDTRMVLRGTLADLNLALDGLSFQPATLAAQLNITLSDLGGAGLGGTAMAMQTIDIGQALPPPPPPALPPDDGDGASAGDGSTIDSDNDEAQESENGDSVSTPVLVVPPPRSIDGGAERYTTARIAAPTSSSVSVDAVLAPAGQWARVITTELESEDDRPLAQGDANRARTTVVDTSPLLADISNEAMLWNELREVQEALESAFTTPWTFGAIAGLGALSAGYVLWGLQAGSLVTSALSSLPVWGSFDPLPVLEFWERESKRKAQQNSDEDDPLLPSEPRATAV
jgi:hypothetical protein